MKENSILMKDRAFYKSFFTMTLVIALQNLVAYSVNFSDSLMVGNYSELSLSGVTLVNQVMFLLQMMTIGLSNGLVVISSQYWGKGKTTPIKRLFSIVLLMGLCVGAAFTVAGFFVPEQILRLLTNDGAVIAEGASFFRVVCFSYFFFVISTMIVSLLRSVETVKIGFIMSVFALIVNVFFNYCFIFGNLGFPEMGARGSGLSTVIARIVECLLAVGYLFFRDKKLNIKLKELFILEKSYWKDYVKHGLPLGLSSTSWGIAMFLQTAIIGRLGQSAIAASSIAVAVHQIVSVIAYGSGASSGVVIGKAVGENRFDEAKRYAKTLQIIYLAVGIFGALALFALTNPIVAVYDVSPDTAKLARTFLYILCFALLGTSYQMPCLTGIVSGGGSTKFVLFNDLIFMWCIVLPLAFLSAFVFKWSIPVTFFLLKSDQITKCAVAAVKVNRFKWIRKLTRDEVSEKAEA